MGSANVIDIFVISLDDATERRQSASRQLDALGLSFEFFDAVRGDEALSGGYVDDSIDYDWILNCGRTPTRGELGCYSSHRALWKKCVELGRPILIMEDDFKLLEDFPAAVEQVEQQIGRYGYLRLQTETRAKHVRVGDAGHFDVRRYTYAPHSLMCYGITPAVAARWVELTSTAREPVDIFVKKFWHHGQPLYGLYPYTVTESALSVATSIRGRREKPRKDFATAARRFMTKVGWAFGRVSFNLRHGKSAEPAAD
jgi:glycosyl transferase family 25